MIKVTINGEEREINGEICVQEFLARMQPGGCQGLAVALNGEILHRGQYARARIKEGDSLELVQMTAGG